LYDYTPFKIYLNAWTAASILITNPLTSPPEYIETKRFDFGWCQILDETNNAACTGDFYAGSYPPIQDQDSWVEGTTCEVPYSGGNPTENISATPIGPDSGIMNMDGGTYEDLSGIALEYSGGEICPSSGAPRTFTVNVYCLNGVEGDYVPVTSSDECNPSVNVVS
jgi:hypothetical protein